MGKKQQLIDAAREVRHNAFAPYSRFPVGAAVRTASGEIFTGCNVESSTYGLTVCAERIAVYKAVSEGADEIRDVVVIADTPGPPSPCGACRQVLWEQAPQARVICVNVDGVESVTSVRALLPRAFDAESLPAGARKRRKKKRKKKR